MKKIYDVAIIGGGASGLAAAITLKRSAPDMSVAIFEKKETAGKKLSASGNGRCNLSNIRCEFAGQVVDFFAGAGIAVREDEEGRLYPYSEDGKAVTEILTSCAIGQGAELILNKAITGMEAGGDGGFLLFVGEEKRPEDAVKASKVLIACGGKSYASMGTTGDGYTMARRMGHNVTRLAPGLTAVETLEDLTPLKGVRSKVQVSLFRGSEMIFSEKGEIQFRNDSISGICVMNMSSRIRPGEGGSFEERFADYKVSINFVPDFDAMDLIRLLKHKMLIKGYSSLDVLRTIVKEPVARYILAYCNVDPSCSAISLIGDDRLVLEIANMLRGMRLSVKGLKGWNEAQITVGGVSMDEINQASMESKLVPGLYFSGEVLDYDGPCGGYNLNNAWVTGMIAGSAMAEKPAAADGGERP